MQKLYIAPTGQYVGLTSVALGMVRALQRQGLRVGFIKPITQASHADDHSAHFAHSLCSIDTSPSMTTAEVLARIADGETDDLLEHIVGMCMQAARDTDVLVIEGLHSDTQRSFPANDLNLDIVRSLHAEVVLVAAVQNAGSDASEVQWIARQYSEAGHPVAGVILNKVPEDFPGESIAGNLRNLPLWGVVHNNPLLMAPRTLDVARHLGAEILIEGDIKTRRMLDTVVSVRSVAGMVHRFTPGALIITAGDRDDVILATALAASRGIQLAGLVLTNGSTVDGRIIYLASQALETGVPVLRVSEDTYATVTRLNRLSPSVAGDDLPRMEQVLDAVADGLNANAMLERIKLPPSVLMSPPAFRYQLIVKARTARKRIVLPEGDEPRTIKAAAHCHEKEIAHCILLGKPDIIIPLAKAQGVELPESVEIIDPDTLIEKYVAPMVELRKNKGMTPGMAREQLRDTVVLGTMMLAAGDVDGLVSGAVHTTANTVRPALQLIKTEPGSSLVSSIFFMLMPDQVLVYGDCAINTDPNAEELATIAIQSARSAQAFGIEPRVAMISYSTGSSGEGVDVEKVREATRIARERAPELLIDGPLQYDAASVPSVGRQKAPDSKVAGRATVFVFPDLNTGNTTYKAVQRSANVVSVGPMLQGLRKPVNDLSRGALVDDIVFTIALTAIQADSHPAP